MSDTAVVVPEYFPKQPLELEVPDGMLRGVYPSVVANLNDQAMLLEVPQVGNMFLPIKIGQNVMVRYVVESWAYEAQVAVAARRDNLDTPLMLVNRPREVTRRLLRKFVRVMAYIDANLHLINDLSEYGKEKYADNELTPVVIEDISGGGARLRVPAAVPTAGMRYALLWFSLPIIHKSFYNMLTRIKFVEDSAPDKFIVVEFTGLSEIERDDIVHYCSRRQLDLVKEKT